MTEIILTKLANLKFLWEVFRKGFILECGLSKIWSIETLSYAVSCMYMTREIHTREQSQIPKSYTDRHYFLLHIGFLQTLGYTLSKSKQQPLLLSPHKMSSITGKVLLKFEIIELLGRKAPQLLCFTFVCVYTAQKG